MSIHIMSAAWGVKGLSSTQKLVLLSLADQANDQGVCWPSVANIVKRCSMSERAARNALRALEESGHLVCHQRAGQSSLYTVTPAPDAPRHDVPDPPAPDAAPHRHEMPPPPARGAPRTISDPSVDPPKKQQARKARFTPPTVDEVRAYCQERGNEIDPEQFVDHYTANGWKVGGKSPMKDWKASVRTWERNRKTGGNANGSHSGPLSAVDRVKQASAERERQRQQAGQQSEPRIVGDEWG